VRRSFDAAQRRAIRAALDVRPAGSHSPVPCPVCARALSETPIATPAALPYVRSRVMLVCGACELGAAFDVKAAGRP
jgi:hypothetical protein